MLPFVRHRNLKIPHGLAAVAAAICLGLAFTSDIQNRLESIKADASTENSVDVVIKVPELPPKDNATRTEPTRSGASDQPVNGRSGFLLPWLPTLR